MLFTRHAINIQAMLRVALSAGAVLLGIAASTPHAPIGDRAGVVYEVSRDVKTSGSGSNGSTSSSNDRDTLLERIISVRDDGLELEYDLPKETTAQDRASNWQFPLRVFKPFSGPPQLLNLAELEGRIEGWLKKGGMSRIACGHWVFTWNAFKIECDPQSALAIVTTYDLRPRDLRDGFIYSDPQASGPIILRRAADEAGEITFNGSVSVDPDRVRREQAQSDVVVAEISRKTLTLDEAVRARSNEKVSGTISISFEVDPSGFVRQRTKITKLETTASNGVVEHRTATEVLKRRVVSDDKSPR